MPKRTASFPIAEEIKREFQSGNHVVFLSGKNVLRLRQAADSYRFQNRRRYLHTAQGTAENGLSAMLEGEAFALHSGASSVAARISAMRGMCADGMLLVVENCDIENDPLFRRCSGCRQIFCCSHRRTTGSMDFRYLKFKNLFANEAFGEENLR